MLVRSDVTIILVPGLVSDGFVWGPALAALAAIAPVRIADNTSQDAIADMARDALALADGPLMVAGHSMGGRIALEMVRQAPDRIEKLVLLDTGTGPLQPGERPGRDKMIALSRDQGIEALIAHWLPPMLAPASRTKADLVAGLSDMIRRADPDIHRRQITALINRPDATALLTEIVCPTLLIVGELDQWSPPARHEQMLAALTNGDLLVVPGAGHFAPLEAPETVTEAIAGWFAD